MVGGVESIAPFWTKSDVACKGGIFLIRLADAQQFVWLRLPLAIIAWRIFGGHPGCKFRSLYIRLGATLIYHRAFLTWHQ